MWARTAEIMLALWLAVSPFVFRHPPDAAGLWWNDVGCAALIALLSLFSFWKRTRAAHLANFAVGGWLVGFAYFGFVHPSGAAPQNDLIIGLITMMLAIIPNEASQPPRQWQEFNRAREASKQMR